MLIEKAIESECIIFICGRYEGVDERLIEAKVDEEWSIADIILSGGELAAMCVLDAMMRLVPGVLGHEDSAMMDSFSENLLEGPQYTRPESWQGLDVPKVLLSGNHDVIETWRYERAKERTYERRPDLFEKFRKQND